MIRPRSHFIDAENFQKPYCRGDHSFSTSAKFFEKLTFLTPTYAQLLVRIKGWENLAFRIILCTYEMINPKANLKYQTRVFSAFLQIFCGLRVRNFRNSMSVTCLIRPCWLLRLKKWWNYLKVILQLNTKILPGTSPTVFAFEMFLRFLLLCTVISRFAQIVLELPHYVSWQSVHTGLFYIPH